METGDLEKLIAKYVRGEATPEEITAVNHWYNSAEKEQNPIDCLSIEQQQLLKQRLLSRIKSNTMAFDLARSAGSGGTWPRRLIYQLSGIAAMILLVIGFLVFRSKDVVKSSVSASMVVVNMTKSIQKIVLSDSSIVWLNPGSRIEYPEKFTVSKRNVKMKGEAFFEVTPDKNRPFIIFSNKVVTRVLGTSFRIRAHEQLPVEVSVITGKVSVSLEQMEHSEIMLSPDQKATFSRETNVLKRQAESQTSAIRIWKKATMSFDNAPIKEVIQALNHRFGVHIRSDNETLLSYVLKADFTDQNLPSILEMLEKSLQIKYEISGQEIVLETK